MMAFGFAEMLLILLMGSSLPSDMEPLPAEQVLRGMPEDCELMAFQDIRAVGDRIDQALSEISGQSWIAGSSELAEGLGELTSGWTEMRREATSELGIDPFADLSSVSLCGKLGTGSMGEPSPEFLVLIQGNFDSTIASRLAPLLEFSTVALSSGATVMGARENGFVIGMATPVDGALVIGTEGYLTPFLTAMPPAAMPTPADPSSLLTRLVELVPHGVQLYVALRPSLATRFLLSSGAPVSFAQLIAGLERAYFLMGNNISYGEVRATDASSFRNYELILSGAGELVRASPHVTAAAARLFFGIVSSDDPDVEEPFRLMASHREEILAMIEEMGLTQTAEVEFNADATSLTTSLTVRNATSLQATSLLMMLGGMMSFRTMRSYDDHYYYEDPPPSDIAPPGY